VLVLFFFKQKTAYEMEFRRVLFRSGSGEKFLEIKEGTMKTILQGRLLPPLPIKLHHSSLLFSPSHHSHSNFKFTVKSPPTITMRSEERRVGKECRSRRSPSDCYKNS